MDAITVNENLYPVTALYPCGLCVDKTYNEVSDDWTVRVGVCLSDKRHDCHIDLCLTAELIRDVVSLHTLAIVIRNSVARSIPCQWTTHWLITAYDDIYAALSDIEKTEKEKSI